ncbi:BTB/POZ domain-containing protein 3-like [Paramacrobiotus metropolitanus]|uniref:BTB/POZ domain-containing protein 3-like n=1 Tax=Paramacrobiotus metropolitanus TaxID=2943436 RepID=UPI0024465107|nr:BTB/POZ domain-containing protein 3-like [Paramacrobiotus metropolitanus]
MSQNSIRHSDAERRAAVEKLADCVKQFLLCDDMSDVQFAVGHEHGAAKIFPAHRFIMGVRSAVFHRMFYGSLPQTCTAPIDIPDIYPEAFANMLRFMYTDTVAGFTPDNVFDTLICADKYELPLLVVMCTDFILDMLNTNNCLHILDRAVRYANAPPTILEKCLCLVDESALIVWQSDQFCAIGLEALRSILRRDTLTANEETICSSADKWAEINCTRHNIDASSINRREMLGQTLFLVRFPLLTDTQLLDGPEKTGLLLQSEVLDIYRYKHATIKPQLPFPTDPRQNGRAEGTINFTVPDVRKLYDSATISDPITVRKLLWSISVTKDIDGPFPALGFYLRCRSYPKSTPWTCQVNAELRLLPWNAKTAPIKRKLSHLFDMDTCKSSWGYSFISMQQLLDLESGYINPADFSLRLQIQMTADLPVGLD